MARTPPRYANFSRYSPRRSTPRRNLFTGGITYSPRSVRAAYDSMYGSVSGRSTDSGVVTTGQRDYKRQYTKKRMPRYKRRRWAKFTKQVKAVLSKTLATQTVLFNATITGSTSVTFPQNFLAAHLYGANGTSNSVETGNSDLASLFSNASAASVSNKKLMFKSGVIDLTMTNSSAATDTVVPSLEVDVYEVVYADEISNNNFLDMITTSQNETSVIGATSIQYNRRGVTLFDFPLLLAKGRMKVLKKTKFFIPADDTATYQVRDPKNYTIDGSLNDNQGYVMPYKTKSIVMMFKPVVNRVDAVISSLKVGVTRKYSYVINEKETVASGVL